MKSQPFALSNRQGQTLPHALRVTFGPQDFPFCFEPIVESIPLSIPMIGVELIGPLGDPGLQIVTGGNRLAVDRLFLRKSRFSTLQKLLGLAWAWLFSCVRSHNSIPPFANMTFTRP